MRRASTRCVYLSCVLSACAAGARGGPVVDFSVDAAAEPTLAEDAAGPAEPNLSVDASPPELDPATQPGVCGDSVCNVNETCEACAPDCGRCLVCELAPSCTGSVAVPSNSTHLTMFDNGKRSIYSSGVDEVTGAPLGTPYGETDCIAPELRMRVRQIKVVRDGVSFGKADVYCVVNASDGAHSEVMITPLQRGVGDDSPPLLFPPEASLFWGQGDTIQTLNNLTITYQCFRAVSNESYTKVFDALQNGATSAGGVAGPWGWAFGVGSVAAGLISAAIPQGQDQSRINVQQTIDASMLLDLTNGRRWEIRGTGDAPGIGGYWDFRLEVETWGCSSARSVVM